MLAESALSFLGIGVQPPGVTWGLMVANGRNYLTSAWWLAFWPGLAILLTAFAPNLLSNWLRIAMDPKLRWRLEQVKGERADGHANDPVLVVRDLEVEFRTGRRRVHAVNGVGFHLDAGETLAILGESGSGKSVTFDAILDIIDSPPGFVTGGRAHYRGEDLLRLPSRRQARAAGSSA